MSLYSLTHLTGRKRNADRKIIIATVETSKQGFLVSVVAAVVSIIPTVIAVILFGAASLVIVPPLFIVAALVLFRMQSSKGLHLPMYKTLLDKSAAKKVRGQILVCGVPIQRNSVVSKVTYSSEDVRETGSITASLFGEDDAPAAAPAYGKATTTAEPRTTEPSAIWA